MKKIIFSVIFSFILLFFNFNNKYENDFFEMKVVNYNGYNLRVSVDGQISSSLPVSGSYHLVDYDCKNANTKVSWDKFNYKLNVTNGDNKGGISCSLEFKSQPLLSEMPVGSYVAYVGDSNNGCDDSNSVNGYTSCSGKNVNYVSDDNMGYGNNQGLQKFRVNGWRVAYIDNGSAYLVSGGATDRICTNSDGTMSYESCSSSINDSAISYKHIDNLNSVANKYCNIKYSNGGICDSTTSWSINSEDFYKIVSKELIINGSCYKKSSLSCGLTNDLIDNGSYYWFANYFNSSFLIWEAWHGMYPIVVNSSFLYGVRPVLYLDSSVVVTGGSGTYKDPYTIGNNTFFIRDNGSVVTETSNTNLTLELMAVDATQMCISTDTSVCTNYIDFSNSYSLDLSGYGTGEHLIYVYYKNSNGNIIASIERTIKLV